MRVCITTIVTPEIMSYGWTTAKQKEEYARANGYDFCCYTQSLDPNRHPAWGKVLALKELMEKGNHEWLFWSDADSFIVESKPLEKYINNDFDIIFAKDPSTLFNTGNFLIKNSEASRDFLRAAYELPQFVKHPWWENAAFVHLVRDGHPVKVDVGAYDFNCIGSLNKGPGPQFVRHMAGARNAVRTGIVNSHFLNHKFTDRLAMNEIINTLGVQLTGAEVGVGSGTFSKHLVGSCDFKKFYCVDSWRHLEQYRDIANGSDSQHEARYLKACQNLNSHGCVEMLRMTSREAAEIIPDESLDFVYIDANHAYEAVSQDLQLYYGKVREGGIFGGHDYVNGERSEGSFGVKRAVNEFVQAHNVRRLFTTTEEWPSWLIFKGSSS